MVPPSSNSSADSSRSFFEHPCSAPSIPVASISVPIAPRSARSTPEGYLLPVLPPTDDPLVISRDAHGHRQLPRVSNMPLPVDDARVVKLVEHQLMIMPKCSNCAEMGVAYPFWFMENLQRQRDLFLLDERDALVKSVNDNRLSPSLFAREFDRAQSWFYCGAQGAICRFMINTRATQHIAVRGYQALAASSTDPAPLLCFISLGVKSHVHPLVLQVVAERLPALFRSFLS
ncbi:hypothetical protein B0H10DRAFT_1942193 [Mycena sp. CBHHK59/15]|nr:hypothetical protein B0H10DRAFT_1942193 [Mycena sp. CBHHK59/15]